MQRVSWTERRTNGDVLKTIDEKWILIDTLNSKEKEMTDDRTTVRHEDELLSLIIEGMVEGTRSRGRPRTKYISQIMKDAGVISYRELKWQRKIEGEFVVNKLLKTNLRIEKTKQIVKKSVGTILDNKKKLK